MSRIHVESERVIDAKPEDVYGFLADYQKRQHILPSSYLDYTLLKGGRGAGTVVRYRLHTARRERPYELHVEEPSRGRVLLERDADSSLVNTWVVSPAADGKQSHVSLTTEWEGSGGVGGFFERTFAPIALRRLYGEMLSKLAEATSKSGVHKAAS